MGKMYESIIQGLQEAIDDAQGKIQLKKKLIGSEYTHGVPERPVRVKMPEFTQLKTDYTIPPMLQKDVDALQKGVEEDVLYVDCLQDEVRQSAHGYTGGEDGLTEEQAEEIITYYCRRRW